MFIFDLGNNKEKELPDMRNRVGTGCATTPSEKYESVDTRTFCGRLNQLLSAPSTGYRWPSALFMLSAPATCPKVELQPQDDTDPDAPGAGLAMYLSEQDMRDSNYSETVERCALAHTAAAAAVCCSTTVLS